MSATSVALTRHRHGTALALASGPERTGDPATNQVSTTVAKDKIGTNITRVFVDETAMWACSSTTLIRATLEGDPTGTADLGFPCGTVTSAAGQVWVASDNGAGHLAKVIQPYPALIERFARVAEWDRTLTETPDGWTIAIPPNSSLRMTHVRRHGTLRSASPAPKPFAPDARPLGLRCRSAGPRRSRADRPQAVRRSGSS